MAHTTLALDLEFIIKGMFFKIAFEDDFFDVAEKNRITYIMSSISESIYIDRSYVECAGNKRLDVFLTSEGWESLCDLMIDTRFCRNVHGVTQESMVDSFIMMAKCYVYECLSKFTDKIEHIELSIDDEKPFEVIVCKDESKDWKSYKGRWQDWEYDDEGNPSVK